MTREEYLKELIKQTGMTIKSFAAYIGMPYTTLISMLNNSIGNASLDNVIKICSALGITIEELQNRTRNETSLSEHEKQLIKSYRNDTCMQTAVDRLLKIEDSDLENNEISIFRAAKSNSNHNPEIEFRSKSDIQKFAKATKVTSDEDL